MEQRTEEWFEARRGKITSSKVKVLMAKRGLGETANTYARQLVADSLLEWFEEGFVSKDMQRGIDLEPEAREAYEAETLQKVTEEGFITENEHEGSSPDGLVGDNGQIEIKCPNVDNHMKYLLMDSCPAEYYDQVQHQLYCSGRDWNDFVSYNNNFKQEHQLKIIRVYPNEEWVEAYETRREEFLIVINNYKEKLCS